MQIYCTHDNFIRAHIYVYLAEGLNTHFTVHTHIYSRYYYYHYYGLLLIFYYNYFHYYYLYNHLITPCIPLI